LALPVVILEITKIEITLSVENLEKNLVQACINNERWAQKALYEEFYSKMMGVCMRFANTEDDALDILHDGFLKVFKNIHKYQVNTSLSAWVHRIMVNTCIDFYRKAVRRRTEDIETAYGIDGYEDNVISNCSQKEILKAVQRLSPAYRAVFNLYVVEGFSHKEIADQLDITESTSRSNLVKARLKLKEMLSAKSYEYEE